MDGDNTTNIPATPRARQKALYPLETGGISAPEPELDTPRPGVYSSKPPFWLTPAGEGIFGHVFPLTPGLTPVRKQSSSPPFAPRPAKRPRVSTPPVVGSSGDETDQTEDLQKQASATAFRSARNLSIDLAGTIGYPVGESRLFQDHEPLCHPIGLGNARTEQQATQPRYTIEIEPFTEDEVEQYLAELLGAYRSCYPEANEGGPWRPGNPDQAQSIRHTLRTLFGHHLRSADDDWFLLQEEEEDVLDVFMTVIRDNRILSGLQRRTFVSLPQCLQHLGDLTDSLFVKQILLSVTTSQGSLFAARLPARKLNGVIQWRLEDIHGIFREIAHLDIA
ncbi:hypothetical protein B0I37DRAFT_410269 [Chaetomium sp. MPI-CAGE-AT-0009]|nr:hypothetical protein B0I37DRAFT_410269 [Chaetomium sp. MPI-CAGE-AT-0009]